MRYLFCFFPWIGLLTGGLCLGWAWFCRVWQVGALLFAGGMTLLPLIVSGGIHLDGLVDTADALYSRRETEKKLEILKDPHVGAFGVMACCGYLLASFALGGKYMKPAADRALRHRIFPVAMLFGCWQWSAFRQLRIPDWRICFPAMRIKKRFGFAAAFIFYWQGRCWFGNFYGSALRC